MAKRHRVVFMGTPDFAVPALNALIHDERFEVVAVVTQPDRPSGRGQQIVLSPIREMARKYAIKTFQSEKVKNNPELVADLTALNPDIIVVVAYGKILPQAILDITKIVNLHGSILPAYRGASPVAGAILNGEKETGVTLMEMTLGMDEGAIIAISEPVNIETLDTTKTLSEKLAQTAAKLLLTKLPLYIEDQIFPTPQDTAQATYTKLIAKTDGEIDWREDEKSITRKIMAYNPWPSAYTRLPIGDARDSSKLLKLLEAEYIEGADNETGVIKNIGGEMMIGHIRILQLQMEGRPAVSGSDFLRGYPKFIGHKFG